MKISLKKNWIIAYATFIVLFLWMISGCFSSREDQLDQNGSDRSLLLKVQTKVMHAEDVEREIVVSAKTEPARRVQLKAEIAGKVIATGAHRGSVVDTGELIVKIDERNLPQRLAEAEALLKQRELEYSASKDLFENKFQAETKLAEAKTLLEQAKANAEALKIDLNYTNVVSPFKGRLDKRFVEIGDFLSIGDPVAEIIEINPFIVVAQVTEYEIFRIRVGMKGYVTLASGEKFEGTVRYIAPSSDPQSRTFTVELLVANDDPYLPVGETAELQLPVGKVKAYAISPGHLTLNEAGNLGVKVVGESNKVVFYPIDIVKSSEDKVWIGNMPETIELITIGQGFAATGQEVVPFPDESEDSSSTSVLNI